MTPNPNLGLCTICDDRKATRRVGPDRLPACSRCRWNLDYYARKTESDLNDAARRITTASRVIFAARFGVSALLDLSKPPRAQVEKLR